MVDIVKHGLNDENQKVKTITALTVSALAEAASPYGIESFDDVLEPLWKGIRLLRGKVSCCPMHCPGLHALQSTTMGDMPVTPVGVRCSLPAALFFTTPGGQNWPDLLFWWLTCSERHAQQMVAPRMYVSLGRVSSEEPLRPAPLGRNGDSKECDQCAG